MHGLLPQASALRHVTLHGAQRDGLRARQRLEQALATVEWTPAGLPPRAVLLVRRLAPARPGGAGNGTPFAHRVAQALNECAARARRPWLHADAAGAGAVVFSDDAEMAACLVRDWLRGVVAERWWWRSVLGDSPPGPWLRRQVLGRGEMLVPVAARLMDGAGPSSQATATVHAWFARLDEAQAQEAFASVQRAFALASPPARQAVATARPQAAGGGTAAINQELDSRLDRDDAIAFARLMSTVPELSDCTLGAPQRLLFAQVLAVVRSPSWARTPQLAQALSQVEHAAARIEAIGRQEQDPPERIEPCIGSNATAHEEAALPAAAAQRRDPVRQHHDRPAMRARSTRPELPVAVGAAPPTIAPDDSAAPSTTQAVASVDAPAPAESSAALPRPEVRVPPRDIAAPHAAPDDVHTGFGGIFYLLNAALALGLYGDFTMPRARGLALSPWDWLALIGKAWFGPAFVRDPVWPLLAALAGRPAGQAPGCDFEAPTSWAIEPSWLLPWGPVAALAVHATRSRLCVRHPAGFLVFDVPRDPALRPLAQARALCAAHACLSGAVLSRARKGVALPRPGTARWLRCMLGYLEARLALTLGAGADADVPSLVCRHAARITAGTSEVDIALQLADLPLPIRIAGLDRDPGWIPAAGRALRFRFI